MPGVDVLLVSLGGTAGLREADAELAASMRRAGASVAVAVVPRVREWRTMAGIDLAWAVNARRAAAAALLWPAPGAIRFDAPAAGNRPARHGVWQRPVERRRFAAAPLLVPWSEGGLAEAPSPHGDAVIVPVPVSASDGPPAPARDLAAVTYGANPHKKGLDRVLSAWRAARRGDETLVVAGLARPDEPGVRFAGLLDRLAYRALLRRARLFVIAPRREDYGIAQLEALADGCLLITSEAPGPYAALPIARVLDRRLVGPDLAAGIRTALDTPPPGYAERARDALARFTPAAVDAVVADTLLPRLLTDPPRAGPP